MGWFREKVTNLGITRYSRIKRYLNNLEQNIAINKKRDKEILVEINQLIDDRVKRVRKLYVINGFFYFFIYFSFISLFFSDLFVISEVTFVFSKIISFFGTTIFIIGVFMVNKMIELNYQDLTLLAAHVISIYNNNHTENEVLFNEASGFTSFINFFRQRGF